MTTEAGSRLMPPRTPRSAGAPGARRGARKGSLLGRQRARGRQLGLQMMRAKVLFEVARLVVARYSSRRKCTRSDRRRF